MNLLKVVKVITVEIVFNVHLSISSQGLLPVASLWVFLLSYVVTNVRTFFYLNINCPKKPSSPFDKSLICVMIDRFQRCDAAVSSSLRQFSPKAALAAADATLGSTTEARKATVLMTGFPDWLKGMGW